MSLLGYLAALEAGLLVAAVLLFLMPGETWRGRG